MVAHGTSYPEQFIYWALKQVFSDAENRVKVLKNIHRYNGGIEFDIGIASQRLAIEYGSTYFHDESREEYDNFKKQICKKYNVRLITIIDDSYNALGHVYDTDYICDKFQIYKKYNNLDKVVDHILKSLGHSIKEVNLREVETKAYEYTHGKLDYNKSLRAIFPALADEYDNSFNGIKSDCIEPYSNLMYNFVCKKCNYGSKGEWITTIAGRACRKTGCPNCGYNWSDNQYHKCGIGLIVKGKNDLESQFPEIVNEWNTRLNTIKPSEIKPNSASRIYFTCTKCGYGSNGEWQVNLYNRTTHKSGCPRCKYNIFSNTYHESVGNGVIYTGVNDLLSKQPELSKEFNSELNKTTPDKVFYSSNKNMYWTCIKCGYGSKGEWYTSPNHRVSNSSSCPNCKYNIFDKTVHGYAGAHGRKSLAEEYPKLAEEWNYELNDITPENVGPGSHKKVHWKCPVCNFGTNGEWIVEVRKRVIGSYPCKVCRYEWQNQ